MDNFSHAIRGLLVIAAFVGILIFIIQSVKFEGFEFLTKTFSFKKPPKAHGEKSGFKSKKIVVMILCSLSLAGAVLYFISN